MIRPQEPQKGLHIYNCRDVLEAPGRYEDRYGKYLELFHTIASTPVNVTVHIHECPVAWAPLLTYMGASVISLINYFDTDAVLYPSMQAGLSKFADDRTLLEVLSGLRPETADALWKLDCQWRDLPRAARCWQSSTRSREFIVTSNGSFHRPEIMDYMRHLQEYVPPHRNLVLVPCAADKPYPAPLHQAVLDRLPVGAGWGLMNATGVVGLVPQELWDVMPNYDSGIPNEWRLYNVARWFFSRFEFDNIVCYTDYYSLSLYHALMAVPRVRDGATRVVFVNPLRFHADYMNLLEPNNLERLEYTLRMCEELPTHISSIYELSKEMTFEPPVVNEGEPIKYLLGGL